MRGDALRRAATFRRAGVIILAASADCVAVGFAAVAEVEGWALEEEL
jgi:hypothetical protein